jgi:hypothetical protein
MARKETPLHRSDAASCESTPVDADGRGNTNELIRLAPRIQNNAGWTSVDVLHRKLVELHNRWSASLAMSTDGSFPSRPRQLPLSGLEDLRFDDLSGGVATARAPVLGRSLHRKRS